MNVSLFAQCVAQLSDTMVRLRCAMVEFFARRGLRNAAANEQAEVTFVIRVSHKKHRITINSDLLEREPEVVGAFASELHQALNVPIIKAISFGQTLCEIAVYEQGQMDILDSHSTARIPGQYVEHKWSLWTRIVDDVQRLAALAEHGEQEQRASWIMEAAELMQLAPDDWTDSFEDVLRAASTESEIMRLCRDTVSKMDGSVEQCFQRANSIEIPEFFRGTAADVVRGCRRVITRYLKFRDWTHAVAPEKFAPLSALSGPIVLESRPLEGTDMDNILLYPWIDTLRDKIHAWHPNDCWEVFSNALLEGMEQFWFALACLADVGLLPVGTLGQEELREAARKLLRLFMRWIPQFRQIQGRFVNRMWLNMLWPQWCGVILILCRNAGMSSKQIEDLAAKGVVAFPQALEAKLQDLGDSLA